MKHFKLFEEFINEDIAPDAGTTGSVSYNCDADDCNLFGISEYTGELIPENSKDYPTGRVVPELRNLVVSGKISFDGNELWYFEDDKVTKKILRKYFDLGRVW
jgi:hypothetical protein